MGALLAFFAIPGAVFFGLGPFFFPEALSRAFGYSGDDPYIARLAGAATFGYAIALAVGVKRGDWLPARLLAAATLVFNIAALLGCAIEFAAGSVQPVVLAIVVNSLVEVASSGWLLLRFRNVRGGPPEIASAGVAFVAFAMFAALVTGLVPLLIPQPAARLVGLNGTDTVIYRMAGAATLGYAAMGILMLRSRNWTEMRLPILMVVVFNGLGLLATVVAVVQGTPVLLPAIVLLVTIIVTPVGALTLLRGPMYSSASLSPLGGRPPAGPAAPIVSA